MTACSLLGLAALVGWAMPALAVPATDNPGSPGDNCSHGASNQTCKPDPQPTRGQDCLDHGNEAKGNEDHCALVPVFPTATAAVLGTVGALGAAFIVLRRRG